MKKNQKNERIAQANDVVRALTAKDIGIEQKEGISPITFATWIRVLQQNWRQGTVGCKGRSDVSFSNKKPWKQKGTGRARAGSPRSPLWRSGGVVFGPQPRVRTIKVSKNIKRGVLYTLLNHYITQHKVLSAHWKLTSENPKTSLAFKFLKENNLHNKKIALFLSRQDNMTYASFINIPNVRILFFDQANAYNVTDSNYWLVLEQDMPLFKEMVSKWS